MERHAFPKLGNTPVDEITQQDVTDGLNLIWFDKHDTAKRVRQRIRGVLGWCESKEYVAKNVAGDAINQALPPLDNGNKNFRSLHYNKVPAAVKTIEEGVASLPAKLCLLFIVHTAARSGAAREATWEEIDWGNAIWTIPAEHMKGRKNQRKPFSIPLTKEALDILERAKVLHNSSNLLWPSATEFNKPMSDRTLLDKLIDVGLHKDTVVHGFRTSFRTWAGNETNIPREVCEIALAHKVGDKVEQAYSQGDLLAKRKALMEQWSAFVLSG